MNIGVFHKAHLEPHAEQGETSASANPKDGEDMAADSGAEEVEPTNKDADAGDQNRGTPSDEPAAP